MLFVLSISLSFGQLKVVSNGQTQIDGQTGYSSQAPRITINSSWTSLTGVNTGMFIVNKNTTTNNWTRLQLGTQNTSSSSSVEDFVTLAARYRRRVSNKSADFHLATLNWGTYASRFAIYYKYGDANDVKFHFNTGYTGSGSSRGIWLDDTAYGHPSFYPNRTNKGYLGKNDRRWYKLYSYKAYLTYSPIIQSDRRLKKDIKEMGSMLDKISKIESVTYKLKLEEDKVDITLEDIHKDSDRPSYLPEFDVEDEKQNAAQLKKDKEEIHYGFIAQDLKKIFPEIVEYDSENDRYGVQYTALIPVLVAGMKEQQVQIENQNERIELLEKRISETNFSNSSKRMKNKSDSNKNGSILYNNHPNPFNDSTVIKYEIDESDVNSDVSLNIYNQSGVLVTSISLEKTPGKGEVSISKKDIGKGIFIYSLSIDGVITDSKTMICVQ